MLGLARCVLRDAPGCAGSLFSMRCVSLMALRKAPDPEVPRALGPIVHTALVAVNPRGGLEGRTTPIQPIRALGVSTHPAVLRCFSRKLSASDGSRAAEILGRREYKERKNSGDCRCS